VSSTAGSLSFASCDQGTFTALDANTGKPLWHFNAGQAITASPITFSFKGRQYIAVEAGSYVLTFALIERSSVAALRHRLGRVILGCERRASSA
jgi:outer membrane protein assembly factor BamB